MNDVTPEAKISTNSSFSTSLPTLQTAHDSTSIKAGKKCWRYYKYHIIDGWSLQGQNPHIIFGWLFHAATELYDRLATDGLDHQSALLSALKWTLENSIDADTKTPWISDEPTKTRKTLLRTIVWYLDHFKDQNMTTLRLSDGKPAVELSFRFETGIDSALTSEPHLLCGHIDKVVEWNDEIWIHDKKTTKYTLDDRYFAQYTPDIQISVYSVAGGLIFHKPISGLIIDGCQILVNGSRFRRKEIPRSPDQLQEFMNGFARYIHDLEFCVQNNDWPMNEEACHNCVFRPVCSLPTPESREEALAGFYSKRTWDPLVPR